MKEIAVLGTGRVGSAIAMDLANNYRVLAIDRDGQALDKLSGNKNIRTLKTDLSEGDLGKMLGPAGLVVSAVPGFMGFQILKKIIEAGRDVVDISFFPEDPFDLDELAREKGVRAVVDCGVAPGLGNIILGRFNQEMKIDFYECLVGGLPVKREWPWQYKAVFSPVDVIEEYVRPARLVMDGKVITREALSDPEWVDFKEIGTLESFNTDGLRTLIKTMDVPTMIEKTLRYPGTLEYLQVLKKNGFFSSDPVEVGGQLIKPVDFTARLLFPAWEIKKGEHDLTVMRIRMSGDLNGRKKSVEYELYDRYDSGTGVLSMARTTGYTCSSVVNLLEKNRIMDKGIIPPEYIGRSKENFDFILAYLKDRKVKLHCRDY